MTIEQEALQEALETLKMKIKIDDLRITYCVEAIQEALKYQRDQIFKEIESLTKEYLKYRVYSAAPSGVLKELKSRLEKEE